jgi:hypothetical protein
MKAALKGNRLFGKQDETDERNEDEGTDSEFDEDMDVAYELESDSHRNKIQYAVHQRAPESSEMS